MDKKKQKRKTYHGKCMSCGDEWAERSASVICPECHSLHVVEVKGG